MIKEIEIIKHIQDGSLESFLKENKDDEACYRFSTKRGGFLKVISFNKDDDVLEISSKCEVVTSLYKNCVKKVSKIANKDDEADRLFNQDVNFVNKKELVPASFDKIIILGDFSKTDLVFYKKLLKNNGEIFLALDNKYSLINFSGRTSEDTSSLYSAIEGKKHLYSKQELLTLFDELSLNSYFYYPLPNYHFIKEIYSDDYLPKVGSYKGVAPSFISDRYVFFNEEEAINEAIKSKSFDLLAPSFIVRLTK